MRYIFIARHGPTSYRHGEKHLDEKKYKHFVPHICNTISKFGNVDTIYTSPQDRCTKTAKILNQTLRTNVHKNKGLSGCVPGKRCYKQKRRCSSFGKKVLTEQGIYY